MSFVILKSHLAHQKLGFCFRNAHRGQDERRLVLASHGSVRDNITSPFPDTQVVPRELMKGELPIKCM